MTGHKPPDFGNQAPVASHFINNANINWGLRPDGTEICRITFTEGVGPSGVVAVAVLTAIGADMVGIARQILEVAEKSNSTKRQNEEARKRAN